MTRLSERNQEKKEQAINFLDIERKKGTDVEKEALNRATRAATITSTIGIRLRKKERQKQ